MSERRAVVAGATGLVGAAIVRRLAARSGPALDVLVRRAVPALAAQPRIRLHVVDFAALPALPPVDDCYIALGTTIKVAGSEAAFRAVDLDAVVAVARAARAAGATRLALVSALGADASSRVFYSRTKGEAEAAVRALGVACVAIARPSMLVGDRRALGQPERAGERLALAISRPLGRLVPASLRPIDGEAVAAALIDAVERGEPGVHVLSSARMQAFA